MLVITVKNDCSVVVVCTMLRLAVLKSVQRSFLIQELRTCCITIFSAFAGKFSVSLSTAALNPVLVSSVMVDSGLLQFDVWVAIPIVMVLAPLVMVPVVMNALTTLPGILTEENDSVSTN